MYTLKDNQCLKVWKIGYFKMSLFWLFFVLNCFVKNFGLVLELFWFWSHLIHTLATLREKKTKIINLPVCLSICKCGFNLWSMLWKTFWKSLLARVKFVIKSLKRLYERGSFQVCWIRFAGVSRRREMKFLVKAKVTRYNGILNHNREVPINSQALAQNPFAFAF